ncbi:MAG TPA: hypothetical protein VGW34_16375 [Allosphingosinicella sp.]|nr:hypothetical protein [Allosphingosinicella sp.]
MIHVQDPDADGDVSEEEMRSFAVGVVRRHFASLLRPLGHGELSDALVQMTVTPFNNRYTDAVKRARTALEAGAFRRAHASARRSPQDELLGGMVARGGPLPHATSLSAVEQETLVRLQLRPTFVGIERRALKAAIEGDVEELESEAVEETLAQPTDRSRGPKSDVGGTWIIRIEEDQARLI